MLKDSRIGPQWLGAPRDIVHLALAFTICPMATQCLPSPSHLVAWTWWTGLTLPTCDYRLGLMLVTELWALWHLLLMVVVSSGMASVMLELALTDLPIVWAPVWLMTPPSTVLEIMLVRKSVRYRLPLLRMLYRRWCLEALQTLRISMVDKVRVLMLPLRGRLLARQRLMTVTVRPAPGWLM